ncbi:unnamed protein product [Darwinula stevensoni]|uniref:Uncharacterized protein n=1 Tax=Darwinula stevensoni TaxID=69355 RepID=A0A7R8X3Y3_9CRUS|nr:unnamed protein product [Darwinula stevensoni]CAG0882851.1 unnamed protein product [Darwinula stevensoni]
MNSKREKGKKRRVLEGSGKETGEGFGGANAGNHADELRMVAISNAVDGSTGEATGDDGKRARSESAGKDLEGVGVGEEAYAARRAPMEELEDVAGPSEEANAREFQEGSETALEGPNVGLEGVVNDGSSEVAEAALLGGLADRGARVQVDGAEGDANARVKRGTGGGMPAATTRKPSGGATRGTTRKPPAGTTESPLFQKSAMHTFWSAFLNLQLSLLNKFEEALDEFQKALPDEFHESYFKQMQVVSEMLAKENGMDDEYYEDMLSVGGDAEN